MSAAQITNPGPSAYKLSPSAPRDVALSANSSTLYATGQDGVLRAYSMSSGDLIGSWTIGSKLGGIDLSPDGSFLMITEESYVAAPGGGVFLTSYRFDLATQTVQTYSATHPETLYGAFLDVAILSDGQVLLNRRYGGYAQILNLETGQYTDGPYLSSYCILSPSEDGSKVLIADGNSSAGGLTIYRTGIGTTPYSYTEGYNFGVQAMSESTGWVAQWIYNLGIRILNSSLQHQTTFTSWRNGSVEGVTFDQTGEHLFILDDETDSIVMVAVSSGSVVRSIPIGFDVGQVTSQITNNLGNKLVLDPTGSFFTVLTSTGVVTVANPYAPVLVGTDGPDTIDGFMFSDRIDGGGGDDTISGGLGGDSLNGGAGADAMTGGMGDDVYLVDDVGDLVVENAAEGTDEIRTSLTVYSLVGLSNVENLTATSNVNHDFRGNSGANVITTGTGNDIVRAFDGGDDTILTGAGTDTIFMVASLTSADIINGGGGVDTLVIQGNYAGGLVFSANVTEIENISILGGNNTNFGEPGTNLYDYVLTTSDSNFAAGVQARINGAALLEGEDFTFDGSAETDAKFVVYGGKGVDTLTGGFGNDIFIYAEERFAPGDTVNGGPGGYDGIFFRGNYTIDFNAPGYNGLMTGIENMTLTSITDERYARGGDPAGFDYDITLADNQLLAGVELTVSGVILQSYETMIVDGSQELDGTFRLFGGRSDDILKGGANNDLLLGNLGADTLSGGSGADIFRYDSTADSSPASRDHILDFTPGTDKIDLSRIDANTLVGGDQAFTWIGSNAFSGSAGQLRAFQQGGDWMLEGDSNGDGVADLVVLLTLQGPTPLGAGDFLL